MSAISSLPEEIQVDIFLKLRLKSIGICRCVCKVWYSVLCNPRFIKTHLSHTTKHNTNSRLMLRGSVNNESVFCSMDYASILSVSSALPASSTTFTCHGTILRDFPIKYTVDKFMELGSSNGLICIGTTGTIRSGICIWNPSTGESKNAQLLQWDFAEDFNLYNARYGFYYDCIIDDYKLVRVFKNNCSGFYQVEVYTVGSELWETTQSSYTFGDHKIVPPVQTLNGAIHWFGFKTTKETSNKVIVAFDISSEEFKDFIFPEEVNPLSSDKSHRILEVMNDRLCIVICNPSFLNRIDVWEMKDYGVTECWNKLFTLTTDLINTSAGNLKLQWCFASGEVLIENNKSRFLYDPRNGRTKVFEIQGIDLSCLPSMNYVESLVSL